MNLEMRNEKTTRFALTMPRQMTIPRWVYVPTLVFIITRIAVLFIAYLGAILLPDTEHAYHLRSPEVVVLDALGSRWDTGFYVSIAEEGYKYEDVPLPSVAFFPLYPLMIRAVAGVVGDAVLAGVLISHVALWLAALLFYRLVAQEWGEAMADRAVWYLLIFPTAVFGSALYTESLFLFVCVAALYFARRGYWESAALFGIAATLTRFVGLIVAPMLLAEWWMQWRDGKRPSFLALLAPLLTPIGTAAYMLYLWLVFGDPLAFVHGAAAWERAPQSPLVAISELLQRPAEGWITAVLSGRIHVDNWIDFLMVLLFLGLGLVLLYRRRWSEAVFVLLGVIIPFSSGLLMSQRRYMWVLFPAFILLAQWGEKPWVDRLITTLSLTGLALFTALFANGYWVG